MKLEQKRGFTLIELLVVIAIIGLLASIVLASLNSARKKSRDARRLADVKQLQNALELYANDHNGNYPSNSTTAANTGETASLGTGALAAIVSGGFMGNIAVDPLGGSRVYVYATAPAGATANDATTYCIGTTIENSTLPTPASTCAAGVDTIAAGDTDTSGVTTHPNYQVGN